MTRHDSNRMPNLDLAKLQCRAQWSKTYPAGRECYVCGMALSKYNPDATCYQHRPEPDFLRYHGMSFALCGECGVVMGRSRRERLRVEGICQECRDERRAEA